MQDVSCVHTCILISYVFISPIHTTRHGSRQFVSYIHTVSPLCCIILSVVFSRCSTKNGRTALMTAAEGGHNETMKTLIAAGADVSLKVGL